MALTPKDKAIELYIKYIDAYNNINLQVSDYKFAKQCALIAVDEMINILKVFPEKDTTSKSVVNFSISRIMYLVQVKQELEKL